MRKLNKCGLEPIKAARALLDHGKIGMSILLLLDEIYLQKDAQYQDEDAQYQGGDVDGERNIFQGVITFMTNILYNSIPFVVKAVPEVKIESKV